MRKIIMQHRRLLGLAGLLLLAACAPLASPATPTPDVVTHDPALVLERDSDVPDLPFPDNPDPAQCGIPVQWGNVNNEAWLSGMYEGELVQPTVFLYSGHLRQSITAQAPHGTAVRIILFQNNPALNYYMVEVLDDAGDKIGEGWIPEPFLSFEPVL